MVTTTLTEAIEIARALAPELSQRADQVDQQAAFPAENIELLGRHGLLGLCVPKSMGGMEATAETFAEVVEIIAGACASTGLVFVMHCCATDLIAQHGSQELKQEILPEIVAGKHLSTLAFSERGSGSNFYASHCKSSICNDKILLSGQKCFVTSGSYADSYAVTAQAPGADDVVKTTIYLLERSNPNLSFEGSWTGLGMRGNSSINMNMKDCAIDKSHVISEQGEAINLALKAVLPRFLLGSAAANTGIAKAALQASVKHAGSRKYAHTGEALESLAVVRSHIGEMQIAVDASEAFVMKVTGKWQSGAEDILLWTMKAKQLAGRTATEVSGLAMKLCGGIAYSGTLSVSRHFRDAYASQVMAFTSDTLLDMVGRSALGLPLL